MADRKREVTTKGIFFETIGEREELIYAPLAGLALRASTEEAEDIERVASGQPSTPESVEVWNMLQAKEPVMGCSSPTDIDEMTILLNQRCNFTCTYCYSARGRSKAELSTAQIHRALEFFVKRNRGNRLSIVFSGGGDPMLSFDKFQEAVNYAEKLAEPQDITLDIGVVTNGSTLADTQINYLKEHRVQTVLSFDILKDVHDRQRSHFDVVAGTLRKMVDEGLPFGLRCTITPLNVCRQCEMVEMLHRVFPQVSSAAFEAVLSRELFMTTEKLASFYDAFVTHFFEARRLGDGYGIDIGNTVMRSVGCRKMRACPGKLVVTPDGTLSACSRVSVAKEPHYDLFRYGHTDSEGVTVDEDKYGELMDENALRHEECAECIAQWHCGGGCLLARRVLSEGITAYCTFMRRMTIETLKYQTR